MAASLRPGRALKLKIDLAVRQRDRLTEQVGASDLDQLYPALLLQSYQLARASVPLLELSLARASELAAEDPVARQLCDYLARHIEEEREHEVWALEDLKITRYGEGQISKPTPPEVAAVVGAQYYWIRHDHPVSIFGYMAVLEGYTLPADLLRSHAVRSTLPEGAFRTMLEHAIVDEKHGDDIFGVLDELPLMQSHTELLGLSALNTAAGLLACMTAALDRL